MIIPRTLLLCFFALQLSAADMESAIVTEISRQFIRTGSTESGQIDNNGNYSGSSSSTGYRVIAYTLRFPERVTVLHFDPRSTAEKIYPIAGIFIKGRDPEIRVGDTVNLLSRKANKAQMQVAGKVWPAWIIKERLMPQHPAANNFTRTMPEEMRTIPSGRFLENQLDKWTFADAQRVFGAPVRQRQAFSKDRVIDGDIYAYPDPTGRYREFELDFDLSTKKLVTVYLYPWSMNWEQCKQSWGDNAGLETYCDGTQMHAYKNRRILVLTDMDGRVINIGLY